MLPLLRPLHPRRVTLALGRIHGQDRAVSLMAWQSQQHAVKPSPMRRFIGVVAQPAMPGVTSAPSTAASASTTGILGPAALVQRGQPVQGSGGPPLPVAEPLTGSRVLYVSTSCSQLTTQDPALGTRTAAWPGQLHRRGIVGESMKEAADANECSICLGTGEDVQVARSLSCGHTFCRSCISRYAATRLREHRAVRCPECQREISHQEAMTCIPEGDVQDLIHSTSSTSDLDTAMIEVPTREFMRLAQAAHFKRCPACGVPIEKAGGCDNMRCRCGHIFKWSEAQSVAPCHQVHRHPELPLWGATCPNCTCLATAKLAAWRAGLTLGAIVGLPVVLATGISVFLMFGCGRLLVSICEFLTEGPRDCLSVDVESDRDAPLERCF